MGFKILENNKKQVQNITDDAVNRALMFVGLQAENYARNNAPVDTSRLRNSITSMPLEDENAVLIGTNVEYAPYQELGTSKMNACNGGRGFLRPAISDHKSEYMQIVKDVLQNG